MFFKKVTNFDKIFTIDLTLCSKCQIDGEDFCGHELYYIFYISLVIKHQFICYIIQIAPIHWIHDVRRHIPEGRERKQETRDTQRDCKIAKFPKWAVWAVWAVRGQLFNFSNGPLLRQHILRIFGPPPSLVSMFSLQKIRKT